MANKINITARERSLIPVTLVGIDYMVRKPKGALGLRIASQFADLQGEDNEGNPEKLSELMDTLVKMLFTKRDVAKVTKRLDDPEDDLDFEHISELMSAVSEETTETPTM